MCTCGVTLACTICLYASMYALLCISRQRKAMLQARTQFISAVKLSRRKSYGGGVCVVGGGRS